MLSNRTVSTPVIGLLCLLLGLLLGLAAGKMPIAEKVDDATGDEAPIRIVEVIINEGEQEELFTQVRKFADKWQYAIRIAPTSSSSERFLIQMWREDIKVIGFYPSDPGELKLGFYYTNPAVPVPEIFFDKEISSLEGFINEIPSATFTVR